MRTRVRFPPPPPIDFDGDVFVFHRGDVADPIVVFDSDGRYQRSFGRDIDFANEHGLRIDRYDNVWVTDNRDHTVMKFSNDGDLTLAGPDRSQLPTRGSLA